MRIPLTIELLEELDFMKGFVQLESISQVKNVHVDMRVGQVSRLSPPPFFLTLIKYYMIAELESHRFESEIQELLSLARP